MLEIGLGLGGVRVGIRIHGSAAMVGVGFGNRRFLHVPFQLGLV